MIRHITLWCLLLVPAAWCSAQSTATKTKYPDSLATVIQQATSDSVKAGANFLLAYYWLARDPAKAQPYLEQGRKAGDKYPYWHAVGFYYEGIFLYMQSEIAKSEVAFMKADSLLSPFKTKQAIAYRSKTWRSYGVLQQAKGDDKAFAEILINKAIPLAIQGGDSLYLGKNHLDLAIVFKNTAQLEKAAAYCLAAIDIFQKLRAQSDLIVAYNTAAENYVMWKKYPQGKEMLDSTKVLLGRRPVQALYIDYYVTETMYFDEMKQYDSSLVSADKGIALAKQLNQRYDEQRLLLQKYYTYFHHQDYRKAKPILNYLSEQPEMMSYITDRLQVYAGLAETNANLGDMPAAYKWAKSYSVLSDSVNESKLKTDIHALEIKFNTAENQKKIAALKAENEKAALAAKNTRLLNWLLGIASLFLLIVAIFALLYYRNNKKLSEQKDLNHQQQLKEIEQQQQIQVSQALLQGEERERRRVAGDLHDGLGGMLAGVKMNLTDFATTAAVTPDTDLHKVIDQLDHSISELRRIARNLMPEALLKFGLEIALNDLCDSLRSDTIRISFQPFGIEKTIPQAKQVNIYRIVQELLTNAIRHGKASDILLQCSQNNDTFFVTLEDNGKGFDTTATTSGKGIGLSNVKSRVDYLHGKIEITSVINEGTTINIEMNVAG